MLLKKVIAGAGRQGQKEQSKMITARKGGAGIQESYIKAAHQGKMRTEVTSSFYHLWRIGLKKRAKICKFL